jgi:hypothetical protein
MEALFESANTFIDLARPWLTSVSAQKTYSWIALATLLSIVAYVVSTLFRSLSEFSADEFSKSYPGPDPSTPAGWTNRKQNLEEFRGQLSSRALKKTLALLLLGIALPGFALATIAFNEQWFLAGTVTLAIAETPIPSTSIQPLDLFNFVLDQALRGMLSDTMEVFSLSTSTISNNVENWVFSGFTLAYRVLSGAVTLTALYALIALIKGRKTINALITTAAEKSVEV